MPRWHQQHFGAACLAQVQCREPPPRPSAKHPPARAQPEMPQLPREGERSWLDPRCPSPGAASPTAGSEPITGARAERDVWGQARCRQGQAALLGTGAERRGWARLCRWHVRAGAGRPRCQAGLAASWRAGEAAGSASSGHHPGAGKGRWGDRPRSSLLPFTRSDEPPTACHHAGCPQGNGFFPSSSLGVGDPSMGDKERAGGDEGDKELVWGHSEKFWAEAKGTLSTPVSRPAVPPLPELPEQLSTLIFTCTEDVGAP